MKIEFSLPSPIEAEGPEKLELNKLISLPFFYGKGSAQAIAAVAKVMRDDGHLVSMFLVLVNGKDGSLSFQERTKRVQADIENEALPEEPEKPKK